MASVVITEITKWTGSMAKGQTETHTGRYVVAAETYGPHPFADDSSLIRDLMAAEVAALRDGAATTATATYSPTLAAANRAHPEGATLVEALALASAALVWMADAAGRADDAALADENS